MVELGVGSVYPARERLDDLYVTQHRNAPEIVRGNCDDRGIESKIDDLWQIEIRISNADVGTFLRKMIFARDFRWIEENLPGSRSEPLLLQFKSVMP